MKDKIKNIALIVLSLIVVFFIVVPWLTGNGTGSSARNIAPVETAKPANYQRTSGPIIESTPQLTSLLNIQTSTPVPSANPVALIAPADPTVQIETRGPNKSVTVYVTATGKKYHKAGCQYLRSSSIAIDLAEAKAKGYTPCSKCHPPQS